ncbi:MAG: hypothetical protein RQ885_03675 [Desulfurococcales archaeon]|nr:hypothetical protein [Desulfurococcales archaeon]
MKISRIMEKLLKDYCGETVEDFVRLENTIESIRKKIEENMDLTNHPEILKRLEKFRKEFEDEVRQIMRRFSEAEEDIMCIHDAIINIEFSKLELEELEKELGLVKETKENKKKRRYDEDEDPWDIYPIIP